MIMRSYNVARTILTENYFEKNNNYNFRDDVCGYYCLNGEPYCHCRILKPVNTYILIKNETDLINFKLMNLVNSKPEPLSSWDFVLTDYKYPFYFPICFPPKCKKEERPLILKNVSKLPKNIKSVSVSEIYHFLTFVENIVNKSPEELGL